MDNVLKWVKIIAFLTNDAKMVAEFVRKNIFSRFGIPRAPISDKGTHLCNRLLYNLLSKYRVRCGVAISYHTQIRGQAGVSNK